MVEAGDSWKWMAGFFFNYLIVKNFAFVHNASFIRSWTSFVHEFTINHSAVFSSTTLKKDHCLEVNIIILIHIFTTMWTISITTCFKKTTTMRTSSEHSNKNYRSNKFY